MNVDPKVREQLTLGRELLAETSQPASGVRGPLRLLRDLIVAHGATELVLAAFCAQLDCVPRKKEPSLADYFDSLTRARSPTTIVPGMNYLSELHKVRLDLYRFHPPDAERWMRAKEQALEYIAGWCQEFLGLSIFDVDSTAGEPPDKSVCATPLRGSAGNTLEPLTPRFNCIGHADIRFSHRGLPERGRIANLSTGGCYLNSDLIPEIGDQLEMTLHVNKTSFRVAGAVVHVPLISFVRNGGSEPGMGVQFKEMSAGARIRLQELIAELKSNRAYA